SLAIRRARRSRLFPYTTLFRSEVLVHPARHVGRAGGAGLAAEDLGVATDLGHVGVPHERPRSWALPQEGHLRQLEEHQVRLVAQDRKSTRLNSSHLGNSYAVFR